MKKQLEQKCNENGDRDLKAKKLKIKKNMKLKMQAKEAETDKINLQKLNILL